MEEPTKLPPIQYAKLRGLYPQKVYAAIRAGKVEAKPCDCGRKVVIVAEADKYFGVGVKDETGKTECDPGLEVEGNT